MSATPLTHSELSPPSAAPDAAVQGFAEPRFERLRALFAEGLEHHEHGAALCVYEHGRPVVDLWGGVADRRGNRPWTQDTLGLIFSATKAVTAVCALMLVEQGRLDLDAPVAEYWPEFGAAGKRSLPVRALLTHQAGLPGFSRLMTVADMEAWEPLVEDLAAQAPRWQPETAHGYHAFTFGWLVGELIRRITGLTPGGFVRRHISQPLGLDLSIGLPATLLDRYAAVEQNLRRTPEDDEGYELVWSEMRALSGRAAMSPLGQRMTLALLQSSMRPALERAAARKIARRQLSDTQAAFQSMLVTIEDLGSERWSHAEFPAGNAFCTARSLARFYAALVGDVDGVRLLGPELVERASRRLAHGRDRVLGATTAFGLGFMVPGSMQFHGWGGRTFGHPGNGGSIGLADLDRGIAFGYVRKRITPLARARRTDALLRALYECL
jgi:CubicO group peptidase (beta-lactamase class C family)